MGRRLRLLWHLGVTGPTGAAAMGPTVVVAPVRALLQRLGPVGPRRDPVTVASGDRVDLEIWCPAGGHGIPP